MKKYLDYIKEKIHPAFLLLIISILAYGLLIPQLGFYWDDLPISWIRYQFGTEALRLYFSTSRPVWGELYQLTTRLLPQVPVFWQIAALLFRWLGAFTLWKILTILWPKSPGMAFTGSLLFLLYPGFNLQWVSFVSTHFFIVLFFFLFSQLLMLWSLANKEKTWVYWSLALLFSALNIWMMEYFYSLELIRFFIIFYFLLQVRTSSNLRQIVFETLKSWLPFLAVLILNVLYRSLVFTNLAYQNELFKDLRSSFFSTLLALFGSVFLDLWRVTVQAWTQVFYIPDIFSHGMRTQFFYIVVVILAVVILVLRADRMAVQRSEALWAMALGMLALLVSGGPYWLAKLEISLGFPTNRFTMSFMLGVSLLLTGVFYLLSARYRFVFITLFIALAVGRQAMWADDFRRDWITQKNMLWQLAWRAPGLEKNTLVFINGDVLSYYADNSLAAELNWIYNPNQQESQVDYALFFPTNRLGGSLPELKPDLPIEFTYLVGRFFGNTSQSVVLYYAPPKCLRVLDPEIDPINRLIPDESLLRDAALLSSTIPILSAQTSEMPDIYGPEPPHNWCYYFEKADLARQLEDWESVTHLGDDAFALDDYPNDPVERFVYIEGYAHTGDWQKAVEYSIASYKVSKNYVGPLLCKLWDRIARETTASAEQKSALTDVRNRFECLP